MGGNDTNIIHFQCPRCGFELEQTIGLLKAEQRLVAATEALHAAVPGPNEITIKFFR
jgi:hypothetical protein